MIRISREMFESAVSEDPDPESREELRDFHRVLRDSPVFHAVLLEVLSDDPLVFAENIGIAFYLGMRMERKRAEAELRQTAPAAA